MKTDIEIARETKLENIRDIAARVGFPDEEVFNYGKYIAKVPYKLIDDAKVKKNHLILVTAITATKAGVGKTTVSIGLGMGLNHIGKNAIFARNLFGGLIEYNVVHDTAKYCVSGNTIVTRSVDGTVIQYNEGYRNLARGRDSDGKLQDGL